MTVTRVGSATPIKLNMTLSSDGRIAGILYGTSPNVGERRTWSQSAVPVRLVDGHPAFYGKKLTKGTTFFKPRGATNNTLVFQSYDRDAAH